MVCCEVQHAKALEVSIVWDEGCLDIISACFSAEELKERGTEENHCSHAWVAGLVTIVSRTSNPKQFLDGLMLSEVKPHV